MGSYGATVITALTSQNTKGVQGVMPVPPEVVASQLRSLLDDLDIRAIKIGQIPTQDVARTIVSELSEYLQNHPIPVIYDPVMISTSGTPLMQSDCIEYVSDALFPLCTLITPNLPELFTAEGTHHTFTTPKITTKNLHGTGCTLSSAIATALAQGNSLPDSVSVAKNLVTEAIRGGSTLHIGNGNGPLWLIHNA